MGQPPTLLASLSYPRAFPNVVPQIPSCYQDAPNSTIPAFLSYPYRNPESTPPPTAHLSSSSLALLIPPLQQPPAADPHPLYPTSLQNPSHSSQKQHPQPPPRPTPPTPSYLADRTSLPPPRQPVAARLLSLRCARMRKVRWRRWVWLRTGGELARGVGFEAGAHGVRDGVSCG